MNGATTREQIVEEADRLFHERGFDHASFADIAAAVGISRGNFYYHFRTKDEILDAVIARRRANVQQTLERWESEGASPADRIRRFIGILVTNQTAIMRRGCPIGTLCGELAKLEHPAQNAAAGLFTLFRDWLARQFAALGCVEEAEGLAMSLLARSQGVAVLANAFHDDAFVQREVADLCAWLDAQRPDHASAR
jgi:TetR/AcrR family transcriptional regulator, transcriptional repressor for nem operon